ncbi:hypothetical protein ACFZAM_00535 [Streptomyces sp. NPDC008079]|uniref:hypothetical protein n=1 Tax=Streptomyces sp. NPDC008079 TaxID=3364806 RepID=UPI0036E6C844
MAAGADLYVTRGEDGAVRITAGPGPSPSPPDGSPAGNGGDPLGPDPSPSPGPGFTEAVLDVAGAVLLWPVLGDPVLPVAEVDDVERAQQWLWAVYGERAAAAVRSCAGGEGAGETTGEAAGDTVAGPAPARVTGDGTALADAAARLAFGHWASRWWPASYADGIPALEPDVLGLELAALTHRCQELFDDRGDQPDDCVAELIEDHQAALDPLVRWWRAEPRSGHTARHLESVLRLIDGAADGAGLDGPELRRLRAELDADQDQVADQDQDQVADLDADRTAPAPLTPGALFASRLGYTLAAGEPLAVGGRVIARGTGTNDWRRYPPGFVDAAESAVSWTARALGGRRRIEVEVVAHIAAPVGGAPLVAEVRVNGGLPVRAPLTRRDDVWTGRADLEPGLSTGELTPRFEVAVLLPGFDPGPGPEGHADREAVRALVRDRLVSAAARPAEGTAPYDASARVTPSAPFLAEIVAATTTGEDY